jgi:hypothetical protein
MEMEMMDVEFTNSLNSFLAGKGYTHLFSAGVDDTDCHPDKDDKGVYWLEPLKAEDPRILDKDPDYAVAEIFSSEVLEMANGQDNVIFMIKVPTEHLKLYETDK